MEDNETPAFTMGSLVPFVFLAQFTMGIALIWVLFVGIPRAIVSVRATQAEVTKNLREFEALRIELDEKHAEVMKVIKALPEEIE